MPRVESRKTYKYLKGERSMFVGRPSHLGNPYHIGVDGTREEVIEKYRQWLRTALLVGGPAKRMYGMLGEADVLLCYCAAAPCHADVLVEFLNEDARGVLRGLRGLG